jgi:WD40-like Beta Propeller Repeat
MLFTRLRNRIVGAACLVALSGVLCGAVALAGKPVPPPPPPPPGTIYYAQGESYWSMKADGSSKVQVQSPRGVPTYQRYGGSRWFLKESFVGYDYHGFDEFGNEIVWMIVDVVAVNETGESVLLATATGPDVGWPTWAKDDSFVSYTGAADTEDGIVGGLVVVAIDWSTGRPAAGPPDLVYATATNSWGDIYIREHDWSPAGNTVAFKYTSGGPLYVAQFSEAGVVTSGLADGSSPVWSPDGNRIAYVRTTYQLGYFLREIWTVDPDGTDPSRLTQSSASTTVQREQNDPAWSPDGVHIAFSEIVFKANKRTYNVLRLPATGGSTTTLTSDGQSGNPQWRP